MALGTQFAQSILGEELNKSTVKSVKGIYTADRNYAIACRFYYHFTIKGLRYERCLSELQKEFNLSELRIAQLIMDEGDSLEKLKAEKNVRKFLTTKFPFYNWN